MPAFSNVPEGIVCRSMIPRRNIVLALVFVALAIGWAMWQHTYAALLLLVPLIAFPFFLSRARRRGGR